MKLNRERINKAKEFFNTTAEIGVLVLCLYVIVSAIVGVFQ